MKTDNIEQEMKLPWHYQERSDAYTHIIRNKDNGHILQGKQFSDGSEERKMRFIIEACNNYYFLKQSNKEILEALKLARMIISEGNHSDIWKSEQGRKIDTAINNAKL